MKRDHIYIMAEVLNNSGDDTVVNLGNVTKPKVGLVLSGSLLTLFIGTFSSFNDDLF